eukprot:1533022-Alexandrium_andersonii.AAC.1
MVGSKNAGPSLAGYVNVMRSAIAFLRCGTPFNGELRRSIAKKLRPRWYVPVLFRARAQCVALNGSWKPFSVFESLMARGSSWR